MLTNIVVSTATVAVSTMTSVIELVRQAFTVSTSGGTTIVTLNLFVVGVIVTSVIPFITEWIKKNKPTWAKKALIPIALGVVLFTGIGLLAGAIYSVGTLIVYIASGIASGALASSVRDVFKGK